MGDKGNKIARLQLIGAFWENLGEFGDQFFGFLRCHSGQHPDSGGAEHVAQPQGAPNCLKPPVSDREVQQPVHTIAAIDQ